MGVVVLLMLVALTVVSAAPTIATAIRRTVVRAICEIGPSADCTGGAVDGQAADASEPPPTRHVYDAENGDDLPGEAARDEGDDPTDDPEVDGAYDNFGLIHDYLRDRFGRNSYDGEGAPLVATVRYRQDPDLPYRNAYWDPNRRQMVFGEGYAQPLDVTAHEVAHALTDATAELEYRGESGALNESISDIFASNLDPDDWEIGEDLPGGAIRDMADPERFDQPAHVDDYRDLPEDVDYGGVHINSGIPNHAYFNMVGRIGRDAAEQIVYRALTEYLESDSGFEDFRAANLDAARDLYGDDGAEYRGVDRAFRDVGLDGTWMAP